MNIFFKTLKEVYKHPGNWVLSFIFTLIIFYLNPVSANFSILKEEFSFQLLFSLMIGAHSLMSVFKQILLVFLGILASLTLCFSIYIIQRQIKMNPAASATGLVLSFVAPACPSCALGLLGVLGFGGFLSYLPFKGAEITYIAIIILIGSLVYLTRIINTTTCKVRK